jgi:hypothetical protein
MRFALPARFGLHCLREVKGQENPAGNPGVTIGRRKPSGSKKASARPTLIAICKVRVRAVN